MAIAESVSRAYEPTPRIRRLREQALAQGPELFQDSWLRPYLYLEGWMGVTDQPTGRIHGIIPVLEGHPLPLRNAAALANVIEHMPVRLYPGELIVGQHSNGGDGVNFRAELGENWLQQFEGRPLTPEQRANVERWANQHPFRWQRLAPVAPRPKAQELAEEHGAIAVWGTDLNHSIRAYEKVLRLGFSGLKAEVEAALAALSPAEPEAANRRANLLAFQRLCDAALTLGPRHAAEARRLAAETTDPTQRAEWETIAEICDRVPSYPARSFREAVQALWFAHMITVWEDGVNANGLGRIDQFLWPYYEQDLAAGRLTRDQAGEILAALWVKLYETYDVQQMMVGGQTPDGEDATNDLSFLVLDVTEGLGFVRCLSARVHRRSPREFIARCVDLLAHGGGIPFFFNDEALIPALVSRGVPLEDARGYAAIGCIEITIPGKANPHAVSNWVNLAKVLELALNDGKDLLDGTQLGPQTGHLEDFSSMEDVIAAYTKQLTYFAEWAVYGSNSAELAHRFQYRLPYLSLLTDDCVAQGKDIIEGGARYNYHSSAAMGLPNTADSLAALDLAVFDQKLISASDLMNALRNDFEGNEGLLQLLRNRLPKYGNDQELPDRYAADLTRQYCDLLAGYRTVCGDPFFCHLFTYVMMLGHGKLTGASPEGRHAGEPLAYSVSPAQGRDREGFTAVLNSLSRLPHHLAAASSSAILEAHPSLLAGEGRKLFTDMLITAIDRGVGQLQINVVSAETLREAQKDPERFRSLCVRVSGFSQQFVLLDREMQDHIIARTKHEK